MPAWKALKFALGNFFNAIMWRKLSLEKAILTQHTQNIAQPSKKDTIHTLWIETCYDFFQTISQKCWIEWESYRPLLRWIFALQEHIWAGFAQVNSWNQPVVPEEYRETGSSTHSLESQARGKTIPLWCSVLFSYDRVFTSFFFLIIV